MPAKTLSWRSGMAALPKASRGWVEIHPDRREFCALHHLIDAPAFLDLRGEIVSGHVRRHVMELSLGEFSGFLKKEHSVRWQDRLASLRHGFGWASKSAREGKFLRDLEGTEPFGPRWVAFGEVDGQAFLLIERIPNAVDLRQFLAGEFDRGRRLFARHLGEWVARLHQTGRDHPDLYAKHVLVDPESWRIRAIDWQRSRRYRRVPLAARCRTLAALDATLPRPSYFEALIEEYLRVTRLPISEKNLLRLVRRQTAELQARSSIRRQREVEGVEPVQRLVWLDGESLCAVPEMRGSFESTDLADWVYDPANDGAVRALPGGRRVRVQVSHYSWSMSRIASRLRGKVWRAEEMKLARQSFAEERRGESPKRLLAFGQRERGLSRAEAFVLFEESA
jgi:tRNA A-37 threonylcarbamoyl transferase component Bud32